MALVLKDRVKETSTTTGTGSLSLDGAATGFQSFSNIGDTNTTYYAIVNLSAPEWEVGIGTYSSSGSTLSRDTILESSNSGSAVDFSAGTKDVFCTYPAEKAVVLDSSDNLVVSGTTTLSGNQIISVTDNTNAALRITQLGTGNALLVEDAANPDSTPFVIDASGRVILGATQSYDAINAFGYGLQNYGVTGTGVFGRFSADANGPLFDFVKSRNASVGGQAVVSSSDTLGTVRFGGSDGTALISAAQIIAQVDGTPGTNDMPGRLIFATTADGASSPTERMRIDSASTTTLYGPNDGPIPILKFSWLETIIPASDTQIAGIEFDSRDSSNAGTSSFIKAYADTVNQGYLTFGTGVGGSATERMRISSGGGVSIGGSGAGSVTLYLQKDITGSTGSYGTFSSQTVKSDVTSSARIFSTTTSTEAASFTLPSLYHFFAQQGTIGAGSTVTNQYGFYAQNNLTGATNNYGFYSNIASGTGRYNFYAAGTADNYFAGNVAIGGTTPSTGTKVYINKGGFGGTTTTLDNHLLLEDDTTINVIYNSPADGVVNHYYRDTANGPTNVSGIFSYSHATDEFSFNKHTVCTGLSTTRTAVTSPASTDGNVFSGTYTPTLTNVTNVAASTAYVCQYMRVGNVVTVSGKIDIDPTATGAIEVDLTLPIASNFASVQQCGGTMNANTGSIVCAVSADTVNDKAQINGNSTTTANTGCFFIFTYTVV